MSLDKFKIKIAEKELEVQIGELAEQASGCCLIKYGDTVVLSTSQIGVAREGMDFFPLTCNYEEKYYAAGRIGGSRFMRREGRPSTEALLTSRMIDRTIRPLFPERFLQEVQVITTCLSWDGENDPDILGLLGSSLSLVISEIPWSGPIGAVRVGKNGDKFVLNPGYSERETSTLDLIFSGIETENGILINMLDGEGKEVSEETIIKAYQFALPFLKKLIDFQKEIAEKVGKKKIDFKQTALEPEFQQAIKNFLGNKLEEALYQKEKQGKQEVLENLREGLVEKIKEDFDETRIGDALFIFEKQQEEILRENIIKKEKRPDGRKLDEVRALSSQTGILPRTHGSGLFTRGETRVLSILTLGSPRDQQLLESMETVGKKRFMHHYNFPPYSVGEVKRLGSPGRREIGHGMLAEKSLLPLIPSFDDFPYTIRAVSEILSSNGSTSMASISATCLALMDAGVPILRPAAGIAIGLFDGESEDCKILTDIQGPEDHFGEMDLKVAGTEKGITAIQMDVKIKGITEEILKESLSRAQKARLEILKNQNKTLARPRPQLSSFAPRIQVVQINPEKIGIVIGPGGRMIKEITEKCEASIDVEETGQIFVSAEKEEAVKKAVDWIKELTREVKVGEIFKGKVKKILDFGAIVEITPNQAGLVHISQFVPFRVEKVRDLVKIGEVIPVKVINIDEQGRVDLSAKEAGFKPVKHGKGKQ